MKELAEYIRMGEEIAANIDASKDALKQYMRRCKNEKIRFTVNCNYNITIAIHNNF